MLIRSIAITAGAALGLSLAAISEVEARPRNGPSGASTKSVSGASGAATRSAVGSATGARRKGPKTCPPSICNNGKTLDGVVLSGDGRLGSAAIKAVVLPVRDTAR